MTRLVGSFDLLYKTDVHSVLKLVSFFDFLESRMVNCLVLNGLFGFPKEELKRIAPPLVLKTTCQERTRQIGQGQEF